MSSTAIATYVHAHDPISQAGVVAQLRIRPEIRVVDTAAAVSGGVVIADRVDDPATRELRRCARTASPG